MSGCLKDQVSLAGHGGCWLVVVDVGWSWWTLAGRGPLVFMGLLTQQTSVMFHQKHENHLVLHFSRRNLHPQEGGGCAGDHQGHGDQREPGHQTESP